MRMGSPCQFRLLFRRLRTKSVALKRLENGGNTGWLCGIETRVSEARLPSRPQVGNGYWFPSLYMYLMFGLYSRRFGSPLRLTFKQHLSYHSITPCRVSPSRSTNTMGVLDCICLT